jgi:dTDP-4-amino-4,6-dideoxygalactose transaminase
MKNIPIVNLKAEYRAIKHMVDERLIAVAASGNYILGAEVEAFEKEFAFYLQAKHVTGVNSGTDALYFALRALGVGKADEVITTPCTFIATSEAIVRCGAKPVFVDVREGDSNINTELIEKAITKKTKVILPVHLYGFPCDMGKINEIAQAHKLKVVEDCAQAVGAFDHGRRVGNLSDVSCFSFYPTKNLGAFGDGGALVTRDDSLDEQAKALRTHGSELRGYYDQFGANSRLDEIQATVLRVKLLYVDRWNTMRRRLAKNYDGLFEDMKGVDLFRPTEGTVPVYYLYAVLVDRRDALQERLAEKGISSIVHYPVPLHLVEALKFLGYKEGDFPVAEKISRRILAIPLYPELTFQDQEDIASEIDRLLK